MNKPKGLLLLLFIFPLFIFSQKLDSVTVYKINKEVRSIEREGDYTKAYRLINQLEAKFDKKEYSKLRSYTLQTKSGIQKNLGAYEESIETAREALQICIELKDTINLAYNYNLIGIDYYFLSNYDSTKIYYEKSYELKKKIKADESLLAVSAYNLAMVYEDLAQPKKALELYLEAENNLLMSNPEHTFLSDVYIGIAHLYYYKKDINKAAEYAEKAMDIGLKSYGEFNPNMTFVYTSYANILENEEKYKESIELLKKALKIRESTYGSIHEWTCESYYDLADAYQLDGQFDKAESLYKKAVVTGEKIKNSKNSYFAKTNLAIFFIEHKKNLEEAKTLLTSSLEHYISVYGIKNEYVAENYFYLAKISKIQNDAKRFFALIEKSLESSDYDPKELNETISPFEVLDVLVLKGEWFQKEYERTSDLDFLRKKYDLLDEKTALIKFTQKNFSSDRSRINLANENRDIFEGGLNTCWTLYHKGNKDIKYLNKAFELSETNRNTSLLQGIQNEQFKKYANIPADLLTLEKQIKQELARVKLDLYYEKTSSSTDKEVLGKLLNQRIVLSNRLDSLEDSFHLKYPKYRDLKDDNRIMKPVDIQVDLDSDTQIITYFLGDKNLYSFNITKDKVVFLRGKVVEVVKKEIETLKKQILKQQDIDTASKKLYLFLLGQQMENTKSSLVIIPDNVLNYIPFEILKNENNETLMEKYSVSYSGSAHLYLELNNDYNKYNSPEFWMGFSADNDEYNTLSSTNDEVQIISELLGGTAFLGEESKKDNFFLNNKNYSILHFAMHAKIDNNNPLNNRLIFSDGELTSSEIYVSDIKANLAVLSACNTGFGKLEKGEGVMSMARAFNYSGVPSVIMSLWKVPDKETKTIMVSFYKHLNKGKSKSEALRDAKMDYLNSVNDEYLRHPYFWSGFILSGNTKELNSPSNSHYYFVGGILVIGLIILGKRNNRYQT